MQAALQEVNTAMQRYFQNLAIHESMVAAGETDGTVEPERPDLEAIADRLGLRHSTLDPRDARTIRQEPIASSVDVGSAPAQQPVEFADLMYGFQSQQGFMEPHPLFSPLQTVDRQRSIHYMTWKTDEREAYVPALAEVRDEVIEAIRRREARELAHAAAEQLGEQMTSEMTVEDALEAGLISEPQRENWKSSLGPFSWMTPAGFGQASIGSVPELDPVGDAFMRSVFFTEPGQWTVATNQRESVIYLVRPVEFQPSIEELRDRFLQPQERMMATFIEAGPMQSIRDGFIQGIDDRTDFQLLIDQER